MKRESGFILERHGDWLDKIVISTLNCTQKGKSLQNLPCGKISCNNFPSTKVDEKLEYAAESKEC